VSTATLKHPHLHVLPHGRWHADFVQLVDRKLSDVEKMASCEMQDEDATGEKWMAATAAC